MREYNKYISPEADFILRAPEALEIFVLKYFFLIEN